jgi:hypothetical protein
VATLQRYPDRWDPTEIDDRGLPLAAPSSAPLFGFPQCSGRFPFTLLALNESEGSTRREAGLRCLSSWSGGSVEKGAASYGGCALNFFV